MGGEELSGGKALAEKIVNCLRKTIEASLSIKTCVGCTTFTSNSLKKFTNETTCLLVSTAKGCS